MNRRRLVIGIVGFIALAAVLIGVVWQSPSAAPITVRFHSFSTNGPVLLAFGVVSNATTADFAVNVSAEYMTNGAVLAAPRYFEILGGTEHGLVHTTVAPGSNHCRLVVQYRRTSTTRVGAMFEVLRIKLVGERPFKRGYSDEFHTPP
jgi:hypothetical protein